MNHLVSLMSISSLVSDCLGAASVPGGYHFSKHTVSLRLPEYQICQLDFICKKLGISRQRLVAQMVTDGIFNVGEEISEVLGEVDGLESDAFNNQLCAFLPDDAPELSDIA